MNKYLPVIQKINKAIEEFNSYIRAEFAIPFLDTNKLDDNNHFLKTRDTRWEDNPFPGRPELGGVYFYMGSSEGENPELYVYVGKASLTSNIGKRLYHHLRNKWDEEHVIKSNISEERFRVELICAVPFENTAMTCFAPALEELIINKLSGEDYTLLNIKGNCN